MNPSFLRMLCSFAHIEKDQEFKSCTSKCHSQLGNAIIVTSPTGPAPPLKDGIELFHSLTKAIQFCNSEAQATCGKSFTIVVYEGTYFIPPLCIYATNPYTLEIIGMGNVRLVLTLNREDLYAISLIGNMQFTIKNVMLYQRAFCFGMPLLGGLSGTQVDLINVAMHPGGEGQCLRVMESPPLNPFHLPPSSMKTIFRVKHSCLFKAFCTFNVYGDAELHIMNSTIKAFDDTADGLSNNGALFADSSLFYYPGGFINFTNQSKGRFLKCQFAGNKSFGVDEDGAMFFINACDQSQLEFYETTFTTHHGAMRLRNSNTKAIVKKCSFKEIFSPIEIDLNASIDILNNDFHYFGLEVRTNTDGCIRIENNKCLLDPVIKKDKVSLMPKHDFSRSLKIELLKDDIGGQRLPTRKEQSLADDKLDVMSCMNAKLPDDLSEFNAKRCHKCKMFQKMELMVREVRYLYCNGCKTTCYCSKECQVADWPDHKLECKKMARALKKQKANKSNEEE